MKTLRRICAATILSLTLAVAAFAGDIHAPGVKATDASTTTTTITTKTDATATIDITSLIILTVLTVTYS